MAKAKSSPSRNDFLSAIDFDFDKGTAFWKIDIGSRAKAGEVVGYIGDGDYIRFGLNGEKYLLHVVMYFVYHGVWPEEVDHKDRDRQNNKIDNLVDGSHEDNMQNLGLRIDNQFGCRGVSKCSKSTSNPWIVRIRLKGKQLVHERFASFDEAKQKAQETYESLGLSHG